MVLANETPWADEAIATTDPWIPRVEKVGCLIGRGDFGLSTKSTGMLFRSIAGVSDPSPA